MLSCNAEGFPHTVSVSLSSTLEVIALKCYSRRRGELADILLLQLLLAVLGLPARTPERGPGFQ